jgi:hypothetical protein
MRSRLIILPAFFCALLSTVCAVAEPVTTQQSIFEQWRFHFYIGDYHAESSDNELKSPGSEFGFGLGGLLDYSEHLAWGFDAMLVSRDYDTPDTVSGGPFTVVSDDVGVNSLGLNLIARFSYSAGITNFYAGAGAGLYFTTMTISASTLGFLGTYEETSRDLGYYYNYGLLFDIADGHQLGLEYRNLSLKSDFSPVTTQSISIGGDFLLLTYAMAL